MLDIRVHNTPLLLPASAKATIELVPPLMAEGIQDDFTVPFSAPTRGNEIALQHVHHLPLAERNLTLRPARLGYAGQHVTSGVLRVLGSNEGAVKLSFSAEGLVDRLRDVRLRDALVGNLIDTRPVGGLVPHAKLVSMGAMPHESHCFPMHINEKLYGSENPAWHSDASEWDASKTYAVNDRVFLDEPGPVARKWQWQCTAGHVNNRPDFSPDYWRRIVFSLVNSYDLDAQQYDANTADGNYFAMVPWFRYDWIVRTALAGIGIRAHGDWFDAPATQLMLCANSTPLDGTWPARYFGAERNSGAHAPVISYAPASTPRLPAINTELPPFFTDAHGLWNSASLTFTPDGAGTWGFEAFVMGEFAEADHMAIWPEFADGTPVIDPLTGMPMVVTAGPSSTYHETDLYFSLEVAVADVGRPIVFRTGALAAGSDMPAFEIIGCHIMGTFAPPAGVNQYQHVIDPAQHVPDMLLGDFLQAVADTFGLEVVPDLANDALALNVRAKAVGGYTHTPDQGHRVAGPIELDHGRRVQGMRFAWPVEHIDPASLLGSTLALEGDTEADLAGPVDANTHAIVRSTRKIFQAEVLRRDDGDIYVWREKGYTIPPAVAGDPDHATDMPAPIKPVMMDEQWIDGRKLLMPRMDQAGESAFFATGPRDAELHIAVNAPRSRAREDGAFFPGSASWGIDNSGSEREGLLLPAARDKVIITVPGFWERWHQAWAEALVNSEPITTDLLLDLPFIRGRAWHRIMPMLGQLYILERMPITFGSGSTADLISKGAFLRRLRLGGDAGRAGGNQEIGAILDML